MTLSLFLLGWQIRSMRAKGRPAEWRVMVALFLLLALLFPVISITDDLLATAGAADVEHMLRKPLEPMHPAPLLAVVDLFTGAALLLFGLRQRRIMESVVRTDSGLVRLSLGLVRTSSVRPPPALALLPAA